MPKKGANVEKETKAILASIENLPPFSAVALKVLQVVQDKTTSAKDIADIIQYDQAITLTCLKLCNSAFFGLKQKVNSIQQAVVFIGEKSLIKIVLATTAGFAHSKIKSQSRGLWVHSVSCAMMSMILLEKIREVKTLASDFEPTDDYMLYTCSLIHDIGRLILDQFIVRDYDKVEILQARGVTNQLEVERELYGIDHAKLGGFIAERWGFPKELCSPIRAHHRRFSEKLSGPVNLTDILTLSNTIVNTFQFYDDNVSVVIHPFILERFGITEDDIVAMKYDLYKELSKADELLNLEELL